MIDQYYIIVFVFFIVALFYSSVGFGGGSSYLAILALAGTAMLTMRPTALMCNIVVVTGGTFIFYQHKYIKLKSTLPLVVASVPLAFIGGYLPIKEQVFFILLGGSLFIAALLLWFQNQISRQQSSSKSFSPTGNVFLGGSIGLLSGLVGIGGGIFLSPILHLLRWSDSKTIAATASFFILVNSLAGLLGQWSQSQFTIDFSFSWPLLLAVFFGGQIGSRISANQLSPLVIKKITAVLIMLISLKILNEHVL